MEILSTHLDAGCAARASYDIDGSWNNQKTNMRDLHSPNKTGRRSKLELMIEPNSQQLKDRDVSLQLKTTSCPDSATTWQSSST